MQTTPAITVSVIGASGYSGLELVRILARHPQVRIGSLIAQSTVGKKFSDLSLVPGFDAPFVAFTPDAVAGSDLVFVALPSGEALDIIPTLVASGAKVIDLGGDFRLRNTTEYSTFYKREHSAVELLATSVYGLPEWNKAAIRNASFIANPGCYATSIALPLLPLVKDTQIANSNVMISSLSGVSGAGKKSAFEYSFTEINDSVQAYRTGGTHQHIPEVRQALREIAGGDISFSFVPHLAPITRGIHTTIMAPLASGATAESVAESFAAAYADAPFVSLIGSAAPALKRVQQTNMIEIGWSIDRDANTLAVFATIDNLLKGAAGQAVQNMNIMCGFDETTAL
ncbi:MAG: N-acetyl-gamma-glutamyl-phosphate reductase [Bacteroidetes bacterium]|nr:N-acetyl-gamma-glutamyl-phosphate reductase [Bacteroidota bacterium]